MRTLRGPSDVRSMAGTGSVGARPKERHVLQFKIGCLELERSRRLKERTGAMERIRGIDERMAVIDMEIRKHHEDLGYAGSPPDSLDAGGRDGRTSGSAQPRRMIRYGS